MGVLFFDDDYFEILAGHNQRIRSADIHAFEQCCDVRSQMRLLVGIQRRIHLVCWPVEVTEHIDPVRRGVIAKVEVTPGTAYVGCLGPE